MASAAVVTTSSGKDAVAEGLLDLLRPAIQQLDVHVHSVRYMRMYFIVVWMVQRPPSPLELTRFTVS